MTVKKKKGSEFNPKPATFPIVFSRSQALPYAPVVIGVYTVNGHNLRFFFHVFYHEAHEEHEEKLFFNSDLFLVPRQSLGTRAKNQPQKV